MVVYAERLAFLASGLSPAIHSGLRRPSVTGIHHSLSPVRFPTRDRIRVPLKSPICSASSAATSTSTTVPYSGTSTTISATTASSNPPVLTFQDALRRLTEYWAAKGCLVWHPYNVEVGAGTMNPATFLRVLGPEPWSVAYDEPSIRPDDSRYGENPNRLQRHTQFQVILKPAPVCPQELVIGSYEALGIDTCANDIRFVEDNWESPALGAWGLGWEVWLNGMEATQFTYFQQAGGLTLDSVSVEITYGLERIIMSLQGKDHFKDIIFAPGLTYGDIFMQNEIEMSRYNMDEADIDRNKQLFDIYEAEALALLEKRLPVPAYNYVLKASHTFNTLDARGAIGVTERARFFQRMRALSRNVAQLWLARREELDFPLLSSDHVSPLTASSSSATSTPAPGSAVSEPISSSQDTADFVFELGLEEFPASDVSNCIEQMRKLIITLLKEARLPYSTVEVNGTPRRISVYVRDLQTRQSDETKRVRGPPLRAALKDGEMTKAATGFMRSQGVSKDAIEIDEAEGYLYATIHEKGQPTEHVIAERMSSSVLERLSFGKGMRWNDTGVSFLRPVRWLLCLLHDRVVPVSFAGVTSSDFTRSLRKSDGFSEDVSVPSASKYYATLEEMQIVSSRCSRTSYIREVSIRLAEEVGGRILPDRLEGPLMDEVTDLVENPIPLLGRFDEEYLRLPKEVLETVMVKHQRYLPVIHADSDEPINAFITVVNGDSDKVDLAAIRRGNEAVLRARYSDAAFFYDKDTIDKKLAEFLPNLSGLTFQESLGSMLDKTHRVSSCVVPLSGLLMLTDAELTDAQQIAQLFKADLATSMVVEMTSLAGTIGRHYAEKSGEASSSVSEGIFEACLPRFSGDQVAKSKAGAIVAIADRMDSLVGLFSVGLLPKSTADPFGLRRAALGVVQTLVAAKFDVDMSEIVEMTSSTIAKQTGKAVLPDIQEATLDFIAKRLEGYLLDNLGHADDIVKATLAVKKNTNNPLAAISTCEMLGNLVRDDRDMLAQAQEAHCRAARLLTSVKDVSVNELLETDVKEDLFDCAEEKALWDLLKDGESDKESRQSLRDIATKTQKLAAIKDTVDAFYDGVFVNVKDANIRRNRLALSSRITAITRDIADLSFLLLD